MSTRIWFLMGRKLAGEATLDELRELDLLLLHNEELSQKLQLHENYFYATSNKTQSDEELNEIWEKFESDIATNDAEKSWGSQSHRPVQHSRSKFLPLKKRHYAIAAVMGFLMLGSGILYFYSGRLKSIDRFSSLHQTVIHTSVEEKTRKVLPDGSVIWLNKGSNITYDENFNKTNRNLKLQGEAFFDVAHKAELPMVVYAGTVQVRVKGTAFNVRAYEDEGKVEASLIRGVIELFAVENNIERKILMKPNDKVSIQTSSLLLLHTVNPEDLRASNSIEIDSLSTESSSGLIPEISWIQDKLVFNNETFAELSNRLSKWYNVEIELDNTSLSAERFTGVFHGETLEEALEALQLTYKFHYKIAGNKVEITKK